MDPTHAVPIVLNGRRLRVLIVGGGAVGARRATSFIESGSMVTVVTSAVVAELPAGATVRVKPFDAADLRGMNVVVAATDDAEVNRTIAEAAATLGILCCRADDARAGDFAIAAKAFAGPITVGITAGSPHLSREVRRVVTQAIKPLADHATAVAALRPTVLAATDDEHLKKAAMNDAASAEGQATFTTDGADGLRLWLAHRHPWLRATLVEP